MQTCTPQWRRERAIEAASLIAREHGLKADRPSILKDSNNTIVHLAPNSMVAKVATSRFRRHNPSNLEHELRIALYLAAAGAPIVLPSRDIAPAVYRYQDLEVTFWQFCEGDVREEIDHPELVEVLKEFHQGLTGYHGPINHFTEQYEECLELLGVDRLTGELSREERRFLRQAYEQMRSQLDSFTFDCQPVHMEVHSGNVLWTTQSPLLIDFESCCLGPRELDFLLFTEESLSGAPDLNPQLMSVLSGLRSFCVAVRCWSQPDRAPEVREAAQYHLNVLRERPFERGQEKLAERADLH